MDDFGYIKLHRKLMDNPIYKNSKVLHLWVHLLLSANHKEQKILWNGEEMIVSPGQIVTGREKLSNSTGLTPQNIRTALKVLKSTSKITIKSYSKFSIITVNKWEEYQGANQQTNQQLTSNQPATNQQLTTNKNNKNDKHDKKRAYIARTHEALTIKDIERVNFFEEMEVIPTLNKFIHERKQAGKKILREVYDSWKFDRRGDFFEAREAFLKSIDWEIDGESDRFYEAAIFYSESPDVQDGKIMKLENFIKQWRNFYAGYEESKKQRIRYG